MMHRKRIMGLIFAAVIANSFFASDLFAAKPLMREGFEESFSSMVKKGWNLPAGCSIVSDTRKKDNRVLQITTSRGQIRTAALFLLPVESGKIYSGKVKVRCKNVQKIREKENLHIRERGASIFFELADGNKGWVLGGTFAKGLFGTHEEWVEIEIPNTIRILPPVEYIRIWLVVEGSGVAEFDDLEVREYDESKEAVSKFLPANGELLKDAHPTFTWVVHEKTKPRAEVLLSKDPTFPEKSTLSILDKEKKGFIRANFALSPGKWYWKASLFFERFMVESDVHTLSVPKGMENSPVKIIPLWENTYTPEKSPILKARIFPEQKISIGDVKIEIDGREGEIKSVDNSVVVFSPSQDLPPGLHTVEVGYKGQVSEFHYCNVKPGNKVTFRKDNITLVNGVPFFPLGAYRDPSNRLDDFSGVKEAGFNLTHSYYFEEKADLKAAKKYLEAAEKNGLMVFMGVPRAKVGAFDTKWIEKYIASLKGSKALLNWYSDEPSGDSVLALSETYKAIKNIDQNHPVNITFCTLPGKNFLTKGLFDLMWTDLYPVRTDAFPVKSYEEFLSSAEKISENIDKPHWVVLQGHDLRVWPDKTAKKAKYPTPDQTRFMAHFALSQGATGLIWYWGPAYNLQKDTPEIWRGICDTVQEIKKLTPYLTGNREPLILKLPDEFRYWSCSANGKRVLAVINTTHGTVNTKFSIKPHSGKEMVYFDTNQKVRVSNGYIDEKFPPLGVKIYSWNE